MPTKEEDLKKIDALIGKEEDNLEFLQQRKTNLLAQNIQANTTDIDREIRVQKLHLVGKNEARQAVTEGKKIGEIIKTEKDELQRLRDERDKKIQGPPVDLDGAEALNKKAQTQEIVIAGKKEAQQAIGEVAMAQQPMKLKFSIIDGSGDEFAVTTIRLPCGAMDGIDLVQQPVFDAPEGIAVPQKLLG